MKILVVHDREETRQALVDVCKHSIDPQPVVDEAEDYISARAQLGARLYDVAIFDLTLPHIAGQGEVTYTAAENLLKEVFEFGELYAPGDVIGITRDTEALNIVDTSIGPHLMAIVAEQDDGVWKQLINDRLQYVDRTRAARQRSISRHHDLDVCILTALDKELAPFREFLDLAEDPSRFPGTYKFSFTDKDGRWRSGAIHSIGRAGQPRSASITQSLLNVYRPKYVFMTGICGGVRGRVKLGDVIIFETVYDWDQGKWKSNNSQASFHARPEPILIRDSEFHRTARDFMAQGQDQFQAQSQACSTEHQAPKYRSSLHMLPAASGSAVVGNKDIIGRIVGTLNDSIAAVDMESYGMYAACRTTNAAPPQFACIKSVSDFCDGSKNDQYHGYCSALSARVLVELIKAWISYS